MNLGAYELDGRNQYADFARAIAAIIETIASQQSAFRLQQVQHRSKGVQSLRKKLIDRNILKHQAIEDHIKDLAGCRAILYTNADVIQFIHSGIIGHTFAVDWDRTKFHYPMQEPTAEDGFISYNYVVKLKDDRLSLPEYAQFAGMACEIQVQTTLDHAWSEMAHDTIYKPPAAGFGKELMASVADRMTQIMQKYLRPAGFDFQKVAADVRTLEHGRAVLEKDPLARLREARDNNERYDLLTEYEEYVVPYYDDLAAVAPMLRREMIALVRAARSSTTKPGRFGDMTFDGHSSDEVVTKALDVVDRVRFMSPEAVDATFKTICALFPNATSGQRSRLFQSLERLSKHNLDIWRVAGPIVQVRLVRLISSMSDKGRRTLAPAVIKTLQFVLDPDVEGSTSTYNTVTLTRGGVIPTLEYLKTRRDAVSVLEGLFEASTSIADQLQILTALHTAGRLPYNAAASAELIDATMVDTTQIVEFVGTLAERLPYEVLQKYEHDLLWKYRHTSALPPSVGDDATLEGNRMRLRNAIIAFRDQINADPELVIYKTLVGFDSVFASDWETDGHDVRIQLEGRELEIKRLAQSVDESSFDLWLKRIRRCAGTKSNDGATFPSFRSFLIHLGHSQPKLLMRLFDHLDDDLGWFVSSMLQGLESGPLEAEGRARAVTWIEEGKHLLQIVAYCDVSRVLDVACSTKRRSVRSPRTRIGL